ncbi:MAG: hypothetical protein OQK77_01040, partial [Psychromonas sp.]|nr:hypothetical protein [Psychromonas sp.]
YLLKPFSYKKLENRLVKALEKRTVLGGIYDALAVRNYKRALAECVKASQAHSKYMLAIMRLKGEVLLNLEQPKLALDLYELILSHRDFSWAKLGKAIAYYHLTDYTTAAALLTELCELRETRIEALNWLASIYTQRKCYAKAEEILIESVKLSPKNISRQRALANIASLQGDWDIALRCFKSVLDNTRFSVHEHTDHHFNYIHCLLDHAQSSNQLQQAKIFSQTQAILKSAYQRFDKPLIHELEKVASARIMMMKGELKLASELLYSCNDEVILNCGRDSGLALAKAWLELGEHEKYNEIMALITLPEASNSIEEMSYFLLINEVNIGHQEKIAKLLNLNEQGIKLYRSGLYPAATSVFLEAHELMPNNTQLSLNLAQSMIQGWPENEVFVKKKQIARQCIKVAEAEQLSGISKQRYDAIKKELKAL